MKGCEKSREVAPGAEELSGDCQVNTLTQKHNRGGERVISTSKDIFLALIILMEHTHVQQKECFKTSFISPTHWTCK